MVLTIPVTFFIRDVMARKFFPFKALGGLLIMTGFWCVALSDSFGATRKKKQKKVLFLNYYWY